MITFQKEERKHSEMPSSGKAILSHMVPWLYTSYDYPFITTIASYGAVRYGAYIYWNQADVNLTDLLGWIVFQTIFNF